MTTTDAMQRFVDDELMRAPLLAEQSIEEALMAARRDSTSMLPRERVLWADLQRAITNHRPLLVREFTRSLREQAQQALTEEESTRGAPLSGLGGLALVDETQVEVDVEVARAIEAIRAVAEHELRELMTFTSALVGDMDVARDYNPFRPEVMARALWTAAQAIPLQQAYQVAFMRQACLPFAQLVRKAYAGACSRLEAMGVEPATYRTIIVFGSRSARNQDSFFDGQSNRVERSQPLPGPGGRPSEFAGTRSGAETAAAAPAVSSSPAARATLDEVLARTDELLRALPAGADHVQRETLRRLQQQKMVDSVGQAAEREMIELMSRLFDAVLGDRRLDTDIQNLISRLQTPALRLTLRDPSTLENYTHPLWLLMDRIALQGSIHPPPGDAERTRMLRFMHGLIDTLAQEQARDSDAFRWARERVMSYERARFEQRRTAAEATLTKLQDLEDRALAGAAPPAQPEALDVGHLDTVPAALIDDLAAQPDAAALAEQAGWLQTRRSGEWVRMFMQGRWVQAQLLWYGQQREYWLFADGSTAQNWAIRRLALERMLQMKLLESLTPRSLIRDAASRVLSRIERG